MRPACRGATFVLACTALVALGTAAGAVPGTIRQGPMPVPRSWSHPHTNVAYASIDCRSIGACTAVGVRTDATSAYLSVADVQRHGRWSAPTTITLPGGAVPVTFGLGLRSIACPAQGSCVAVGTYWDPTPGRGFEPMLAQQHGGKWSAATSDVPLPAGATMAELDAIWCKGVGACVATGSFWTTVSSSSHAFVDVQRGDTWEPSVTIPDPNTGGLKTPTEVSPSSIACTSLSSCAVVGEVTGSAQGGAQLGFAAVERGTSWGTHVFFISPTKGTVIDLSSVACPSSAVCVAVGSGGTTAADAVPLAVTYEHGRWNAGLFLSSRYYAPVTHGGQLDSISCPSRDRCVAVGQLLGSGAATSSSLGQLAVAYAWTAGHWSYPALVGAPKTSASPSGGAQLDAVSCPTTRECEVVGTTTPTSVSLKGNWPYSATVAPVSAGHRPGAPSRIRVAASSGSFAVSWHGPTSFGGSPITAFTVIAHSAHEPIVSCVTVSLSCTLAGIAHKHHYVVDVTARNAAKQDSATARSTASG